MSTAEEIIPRLDWADDGLPVDNPADQGVKTAGPQVLAWGAVVLVQPDGSSAGDPWRWTEAQARFIRWWFAVDDDGRYLWRRGQVVLPKGAGKSPMAGALACCELAGPVVFDGEFDKDDKPKMKPHPSPYVKLSALSADQASDATMSLAAAMLSSKRAQQFIGASLDVGITKIRTKHGSLTAATAKAPSKEGLRPTCAILDETSFWQQSNGGHRLAETLRRGLAKTNGRSIECTNMWQLGADSVAERTFDYAEAVKTGKQRGDGVLRWHPTVRCDDLNDSDDVMRALHELYVLKANATWVDLDRIAAEVIDRGTHPADARRFYFNMPASADDAWIRADQWQSCTSFADHLNDGDPVTLGFDGSRGRVRGNADATALVAVRITDGHVAPLGIWQAAEGDDDWQVPAHLVDAAVRQAFERYQVVAMYADPAGWTSEISSWEQSYARKLKVTASAAHPMQYWTNRASMMVRAYAAFEEAVAQGALSHGGNAHLTEHVLNARRKVSHGAGIIIGKEYSDSPRKIDAAVAATLAWAARLDALSKNVARPVGRGRVIVMD